MKNTALAAKFNDTETEQASLLFHFSRGCNNFPRVVTTEQKKQTAVILQRSRNSAT